MKFAVVFTRAACGISAPQVIVETHISRGMAGVRIVGLPERMAKACKERVRSALINAQFEFPARRITINLGPADLPKEGGRFDLPIALGILAASGQIPSQLLNQFEFIGELALSGEIRPVAGILPVVLSAHQNARQLIIPAQNAAEAALAEIDSVFSAEHLLEVCAHLKGERQLPNCIGEPLLKDFSSNLDLADVKGQTHAKRALEIAAAGKHSLLFIGPPGAGKTMLASRITTIMPSLLTHDALEVAAIASLSSEGFRPQHWQQIPFRAPHHTASHIALVGGGRPPRPGEISLAHQGVLFLDELPEFNRSVLEALREPLEAHSVTISRAAYQANFPAKFQLIAAMNPCPCGFLGSTNEECRCTTEQIKRYLGRISGPLLDRLDMQVEVARVSANLLSSQATEKSAIVKDRVMQARHLQAIRQGLQLNGLLSSAELAQFSRLKVEAKQLLEKTIEKFNLSARVYHRVLKVARTIADLAESVEIAENHISEAIQYRCIDRFKTKI